PSHLFHLFHLISLHLCLSFSFFFLALLLVIHSLITPCSTASLIAELSFSPHITLTPSFSCPHPLSFLHHLPRSHLSSPSLSLSLTCPFLPPPPIATAAPASLSPPARCAQLYVHNRQL